MKCKHCDLPIEILDYPGLYYVHTNSMALCHNAMSVEHGWDRNQEFVDKFRFCSAEPETPEEMFNRLVDSYYEL